MGVGGGGAPFTFTYDSLTDSYILSSWVCSQGNFEANIPSSFGLSKPVTSIGPSVFAYCNTLQKVTIPSTIVSIGSNAFFDCSNLTDLNFYGNQPAFGANVFGTNSINAKIYRIPGKNWSTYSVQGRPVELFYPQDYIFKNRIRSGGTGKLITKGDKDAMNYVRRVEAADGQFLEPSIRDAITDFVIGCKNDGIWDAIKSSCILAGARTLNGALIPLKGTAPTNNGFLSADYNRATGLKGNGSSKYLNSNRNTDQDPFDNRHLAVFVKENNSIEAAESLVGSENNFVRTVYLADPPIAYGIGGAACNSPAVLLLSVVSSPASQVGIFAVRRIGSNVLVRTLGNSGSGSSSQNLTNSNPVYVFARSDLSNNIVQPTRCRIAFYSIGEGLDLTLLNARLNTLMSAYSTLT